MADYLVYWRVFWDEVRQDGDNDLQTFLETRVRHDWYTNNQRFFLKIKRGDNLWVVVTGGPTHPHEWRLLQHVVVQRRDMTTHRAHPLYGPFRVLGNNKTSVLFHPAMQNDFAPILHTFNFKSGRKIMLSGRQIGLALQASGHRQLSEADVILLQAYTADLEEA